MGAEENVQDPRVRALRAAGEDRAADILEALAEGEEQQQESQPTVGPPGIPLVSDDPAQRQAEAEGRIIGDRADEFRYRPELGERRSAAR